MATAGKSFYLFEPPKDRKKRAVAIIRTLSKLYPEFGAPVYRADPFEVLISTILSAQTTDENVDKVLPELFTRYPTAHEMATAELSDLEKIIFSTGYYKNKAKLIKNASQYIITNYPDGIPDTVDALIQIPGVGRKTANVVLQAAFNKVTGIVVDTHVFRLSRILGLTDKNYAEKIEQELMDTIPRKYWDIISELLIDHGREVCTARNPKCHKCQIANMCPSADIKNTLD